MGKLLKLVYCQSFVELRDNWKKVKGLLILWGIIIGLVLLAWGLDGEASDLCIWIIYGITFATGTVFQLQEDSYPKIFGYLPLSSKEKKRYLVYRIFAGGMVLVTMELLTVLVLFVTGNLIQSVTPYLLLGWLCFILFQQKEGFFASAKSMTGSIYYPHQEMTKLEKILLWLFRIFDGIGMFVVIFLTLGFVEKDGVNLEVALRIYQVIGGYIIISLAYHVYYVYRFVHDLEV